MNCLIRMYYVFLTDEPFTRWVFNVDQIIQYSFFIKCLLNFLSIGIFWVRISTYICIKWFIPCTSNIDSVAGKLLMKSNEGEWSINVFNEWVLRSRKSGTSHLKGMPLADERNQSRKHSTFPQILFDSFSFLDFVRLRLY